MTFDTAITSLKGAGIRANSLRLQCPSAWSTPHLPTLTLRGRKRLMVGLLGRRPPHSRSNRSTVREAPCSVTAYAASRASIGVTTTTMRIRHALSLELVMLCTARGSTTEGHAKIRRHQGKQQRTKRAHTSDSAMAQRTRRASCRTRPPCRAHFSECHFPLCQYPR